MLVWRRWLAGGYESAARPPGAGPAPVTWPRGPDGPQPGEAPVAGVPLALPGCREPNTITGGRNGNEDHRCARGRS